MIDGLDTISDRDRFLNRMQKLPEHAQLLITLRESSDTDKINYINVSSPKKDIRDYVVSRLDKDAKLSCLNLHEKDDKGAQDDVVRYVVEKSHGL